MDSGVSFSVIIPTFNSSLSIPKTLESLLEQKYKNFEVIIVDDLSDDIIQIESIVDKYLDLGLDITLYASNVKLNGAGARNKGVDISSNEYLAFLDSDDIWLPEKLETYNNIIIENECNSEIVFYSKVRVVKNGFAVKEMPTRPFNKDIETIAGYIFGCAGFIQTSTLVLKRSTFNIVKFNEDFIRHQDYDLCIRLSRIGCRFYFINEVLSEYIITDTPVSLKGENIKYSIYWLNEMKFFLTKKDIHTYKAFKLIKKTQGVRKVTYFTANLPFCNKVHIIDLLNFIVARIKRK